MSAIKTLIEALGVRAECVGEQELEPALIWGDQCFTDGSQLVSIGGEAAVRYLPTARGGALHEACHAIFDPAEDETRIFAFEWLVAGHLNAAERACWIEWFHNCQVTDDESGSQVLGSTLSPAGQMEWDRSLQWLDRKGYTVAGRPVYGLGQCRRFLDGTQSSFSVHSSARETVERWGLSYTLDSNDWIFYEYRRL